MKILIYEQDDQLQEDLVNYFIAEHYESLTTHSAEHAIELVASSDNNIDIVLCDLDQPTSDTLLLIAHLQTSQPELPFVIIAEHASINKIIPTFQKGLWSCIVKPITNFKTVLTTVEQLSHQQHLLTANNIYKQELSEKHKELETEHLAGYKLQQQLLPENNVKILDLNFSYFSHPSLYISGDFIDYQQLSDRYLVFYLADVSGHGVSSAFVTVLLKACITQYCSEYIHLQNDTAIIPSKMLTTLNKVVCAQDLGKYLTMVYMVYDAVLAKISYSIAGHFPFPIYLQSDLSAKFIGERGFPIGTYKGASFEDYELAVHEKFKLALFSDGIMEVRPEQKLADKEQSLLTAFENYHDKDLDTLKQYLAIDSEQQLPDDMSGLVVSK